MKRLLTAFDSFRGSISSTEAGRAARAGAAQVGWQTVVVPLADGGEGTLEALGGANRRTVVRGPLGRPVEAPWQLRGTRAVVEMSRASGLALVGGAEANDPVAASTFGTGELLVAALDAGATEIVVAVGGSATTDGGAGALEALPERPPGLRVRVLCDVTTRFVDAAARFGPQKGADPDQVEFLTRRLEELAARYGPGVAALPGSGAAGGLAGGLAAWGATLHEGFPYVAKAVDLEGQLRGVDRVITGEGCLDGTSWQGKVVGGVFALAPDRTRIVAGQVRQPHPAATSLLERFGERAWTDTAACIAEATREWLAFLG